MEILESGEERTCFDCESSLPNLKQSKKAYLRSEQRADGPITHLRRGVDGITSPCSPYVAVSGVRTACGRAAQQRRHDERSGRRHR
jgi:hypothetical protein